MRMAWTTLLLAILLSCATYAGATTISWVNISKDYAVGEQVGSWNVLDYKDAVAYNSNGVWTTSGLSGGSTRPNGATILWFYYPNSSAQVTLSEKSTAVAFMLENDTNDGYVNFYVDGAPVLENFYMQGLPTETDPSWGVGTLVISGLSDDYHTIKVQSTSFSYPGGRNDFHIYGGAAVEAASIPSTTVPEPSTFILLGAGIAGIALIRNRSRK